MIVLKNICKQFDKQTILHNISFHIGANESVGLIGLNGAGKTTLLNIIAGILKPNSGFIRVNGAETLIQDYQKLRELSYISGAKSQLWEDLQIKDSFTHCIHMYRLEENQARQRLQELCALFQIEALLHQFPNAFGFNEMFLQDKVHDGSITNELLKPVNFMFRLLWENIGEGLFKILFQFIPAVLIIMFYTRLEPPKSMLHLSLMIVSVIFGYLILWLISFIVQTWSFWLFSVWGIMTIKNVIVNILSGALLPLWFMPELMQKMIALTPFEAIYFTPIRIYLGTLSGRELVIEILIQVTWILVLWMIATVFWNRGMKKLVVQGG